MLDLKNIRNSAIIQLLLSILFLLNSCAKDNDSTNDDSINNDIDNISPPYTGGAGNKDISSATALRVFYVAVDGKPSNDGLTQQTPLDIKTAFDVDRIQPGDLYWIKAGDYGKINIELNQPNKTAGTEQNPIGWIGYKSSPGDINAFEGPTVKWDNYLVNGHDLDPNIMPTFSGETSNAPNFLGNGTAIELNHWKEYIVIRNLQIRHYRNGIEMAKGTHNIFDNIIIANNGYFADIIGQGGSNLDLEGHGIRIGRETGYVKVSNSYAANMAKTAFSFRQNSSHNLIEWSEADTDNGNDHNPQDYFFHSVGEYNVFLNIKARKLTESNHSGHGLCFNWDSNQGWGGKYNYAENVEILNTSLHFDGEHTHDNTVKNIKLWEDRNHYIFGASIVFMDGAHHNLLDNATLNDGAISFLDSGAHVDNGNAGNNNIIRNTTVSNNDKAIKFSNWSTEFAAYDNQFINCTFKDLNEGIFEVLRGNYGNKLIGCNIENAPKIWYEDNRSRDYKLSATTVFQDCNFWNSELPLVSTYKVSGITQKSPVDL